MLGSFDGILLAVPYGMLLAVPSGISLGSFWDVVRIFLGCKIHDYFKLSFFVCRYDHLLSLADALEYLNVINYVGILLIVENNIKSVCNGYR